MIVQIYEIQTPAEAEKIVDLGVSTAGSVVLSAEDWRIPTLRETVRLIQSNAMRSSLIPLFSDRDVIRKVLDYYAPDILHFCEAVGGTGRSGDSTGRLRRLQRLVRTEYPEVTIMRSIPIPRPGLAELDRIEELADAFEPVSDCFLVDTLRGTAGDAAAEPVAGFVGITGKICDWDAARRLVDRSRIAVILAGGIAPENVYQAVCRVRPAGIDSCSGTNAVDENGRPIRFCKDRSKVEKLVREVHRAEEQLKREIP